MNAVVRIERHWAGRGFCWLALLFSIVLIIAGCEKTKKKKSNSSNTEVKVGKRGGTVYRQLGSQPETLNPITSHDYYGSRVHNYVFDTFGKKNLDTWDWQPGVFESWEMSKDGLSMTAKMREDVKFHDGKLATSEDVKFSYDVYYDEKFPPTNMRSYLGTIKGFEVVDKFNLKITFKQTYFKNMDIVLGAIALLPKHYYDVENPKDTKFNKEMLGSGPYKMTKLERGQKITLTRTDYWGDKYPEFEGYYNPKRIVYRIIKESSVAFEVFKKGDIDILGLTAEQYVKQTKGDPWGKTAFAHKVKNSDTKNFSYAYLAWNQKNPLFADKRARQAMSHLINRDLLNEKFYYGMMKEATGPFGVGSIATDPSVKPIKFNPKKALSLLKEIGWQLTDEGLVKEIDGQKRKFEFNMVLAAKSRIKHLTVVKEDMKKIGITMNIKLTEWNSLMKLVEERKFDAMYAGWSVNSLKPDPRDLWHSQNATHPGRNYVSFSNKEADRLIEGIRKEADDKQRTDMYFKLHRLIHDEQPYSFMFNRKFSLYANSKRMGIPKPTFKYDIGFDKWWIKD